MQRIWTQHGMAVLAVTLVLFVAAGIASDAAGSKKATQGGGAAAAPVDINRATAAELTAVPGIGKVLAQRIVEFREKNGPFRRVEDLLKVKGIGEKSFEKFRAHIKVSKQS